MMQATVIASRVLYIPRLLCPFSRAPNAKFHPDFCVSGCWIRCRHARCWRPLSDGRSCCDTRVGYRKTMVRRGPASFSGRKSRSNRSIEDRPDRFRPPPYMPDGDPAVWSAGGMMVQDHSVRAPFGQCSPGLSSSSRTASGFFHRLATRRAGAGWRPSWANLVRCR
jgi:hypothetical protein